MIGCPAAIPLRPGVVRCTAGKHGGTPAVGVCRVCSGPSPEREPVVGAAMAEVRRLRRERRRWTCEYCRHLGAAGYGCDLRKGCSRTCWHSFLERAESVCPLMPPPWGPEGAA